MKEDNCRVGCYEQARAQADVSVEVVLGEWRLERVCGIHEKETHRQVKSGFEIVPYVTSLTYTCTRERGRELCNRPPFEEEGGELNMVTTTQLALKSKRVDA